MTVRSCYLGAWSSWGGELEFGDGESQRGEDEEIDSRDTTTVETETQESEHQANANDLASQSMAAELEELQRIVLRAQWEGELESLRALVDSHEAEEPERV